MAEEIHFKNGKISNFEGLLALTLILDQVVCIPPCSARFFFTSAPNFIRTRGHRRRREPP